jgi:hypothetical protein
MKSKELQNELKEKKKVLQIAEAELNKKIDSSGGKYTKEQLKEKTPTKGPSIKKTDAYRNWEKAMKDVDETSKALQQSKDL